MQLAYRLRRTMTSFNMDIQSVNRMNRPYLSLYMENNYTNEKSFSFLEKNNPKSRVIINEHIMLPWWVLSW